MCLLLKSNKISLILRQKNRAKIEKYSLFVVAFDHRLHMIIVATHDSYSWWQFHGGTDRTESDHTRVPDSNWRFSAAMASDSRAEVADSD